LQESVIAAHDNSVYQRKEENEKDLVNDIPPGKVPVTQHFEKLITVLKDLENGRIGSHVLFLSVNI